MDTRRRQGRVNGERTPLAQLIPGGKWTTAVVALVAVLSSVVVAACGPPVQPVEPAQASSESFRLSDWSTVTPASGWTFSAGDFAGDPKSDVMGYYPAQGELWVGTNTGTGFTFSKWSTVAPPTGWTFSTGDFAGDPKTDVMGYYPAQGELWVGTNTGTGFTFSKWSTVAPPTGWTFSAGDFLPGGSDEVVGHHSGGAVQVGVASGSGDPDDPTQLQFSSWASLAGSRPLVATGEFSGGVGDDVLSYDSSSGVLRVGENRQPLKGYAWPLSQGPGGTIDFYISGRGTGRVDYFRQSARFDADLGRSVLHSEAMGSTTFSPQVQRVTNRTLWSTGAGWTSSVALRIPDGSGAWPSGLYTARLTDADGKEFHIPFVVNPTAAERKRIAVLANANTWVAYNNWGGESKYTGASHVSFLRPFPALSPINGAHHLLRGELFILGWLAAEGYQVDVYTDLDFADGEVRAGPGNYDALVLSTHPEYWTDSMYQQMQQFLHDGGSLLNLGGNSVYERGAYALGQTGMVFHGGQDAFEKGSDDRNYQQLRYENLFRSTNSTQERPLLGVATERCAVQGAGYTIREAGHPLFDGTGLGNGSVIGVEGLTDNGPGTIDSGLGASDGGSTYNGGATGWEVDSMNGPGATGLPDRCQMNLIEDSRPPGHNTPLAAGQVELARSRNTDQADPSVSFDGASMTYYEHPSGGVVYSVGSVTFGGSLIVDPHLSTIVSNVLTKALE